MLELVAKGLISGALVVAASELARRSTAAAAIVASLPLVSILALTLLYYETGSTERVIELSYAIVWVVLPSIVLFLVLPILLRSGMNFPVAMVLSCVAMAVAYWLYRLALARAGLGD